MTKIITENDVPESNLIDLANKTKNTLYKSKRVFAYEVSVGKDGKYILYVRLDNKGELETTYFFTTDILLPVSLKDFGVL